ncbi:hypothetical protein LHEJCM1120_03890 [Lactobacillus helveticus]|nr:hypothetical protein LHEJCM1120_03890 [Lactobacillus helveticus]
MKQNDCIDLIFSNITAHTWQKAKGFYQPTTLLVGENYKYHKQDINSKISINEQKKECI